MNARSQHTQEALRFASRGGPPTKKTYHNKAKPCLTVPLLSSCVGVLFLPRKLGAVPGRFA